MVIRGNSRGNGRQLAHYLLAKGENEDIRILDVDGQSDPEASALHRAIFAMNISSELSRGDKGLYHAQINPAPGEDQAMNDTHWLEASDILARQLGLENQRRAIVLHSKKGRTHAHVVWERYDHASGKMVSDSFSRLAQDRARQEMEQSFGHAQTPRRNKHRPELKASLSQLWKQTGTGAQFVKAARENGYIIARGSGRDPFIVVDAFGRSYNLTRQLEGVRLKEVRARLRNETLLGEKEAITIMRKAANDNSDDNGGTGKQKQSSSSFTIKQTPMKEEFSDNNQDITGQDHSKRTSQGASQPKPDNSPKGQFASNKSDIGDPKQQAAEKPKEQTAQQNFADNKHQATGQEPKQGVKEQFAENKGDASESAEKKKDKEREDFKMKMQAMKEKNAKDKSKGPEMG